MQHQDSTRSEHQARNDAQLALLRRTKPEIWTRLLDTLSEAERAQAEERADWGDVAAIEVQAEDRDAGAALAELELDLLDAALSERCACYATGTEQPACLAREAAPEPPYYIATTDQDGRPVVVEDGKRVACECSSTGVAQQTAAAMNAPWQLWQDTRFATRTCAPAPSPEAIALAVELYATGQYDLAGAVREAEAQLASLLAEAEAWDASARDAALTQAEDRNPRRDPFPAEAREIALKGPARIERRFDLIFLDDNSIWRQEGERVVLDVPPLKYLPRHDDHGEAGAASCAVLVISPPDDDPPPPAADAVALPVFSESTEAAVAVARSEALGLPLGERRGLWSFAGTGGELSDLLSA